VASDFGTTVGRFFGHSVTTFPCGHRVADVTYDHPVTTFLFAVEIWGWGSFQGTQKY